VFLLWAITTVLSLSPHYSQTGFFAERVAWQMATENLKCFCTIITANFLPYVLALNESLLQFDDSIQLNVLISDRDEILIDAAKQFSNLRFYFANEICADGIAEKIRDKYRGADMDCFRWSMKPVFMRYLIKKKGFEKIIYVDSDVHFFGDYQFLFDELDQSNVLLTPHWRTSDPHVDSANFLHLYNAGLYNGGFVGANASAVDALDWWARACEFICVKDTSIGQFVDQTHLNLLPVYFDRVKILKHRGCNVANWNQVECRRVKKGEHVLINGDTPIIFIHFTKSTIRGILSGADAELDAYLQKYSNKLNKYGIDVQVYKNDQGSGEKKFTFQFFNPASYKNLYQKKLTKQKIRSLFQRFLS